MGSPHFPPGDAATGARPARCPGTLPGDTHGTGQHPSKGTNSPAGHWGGALICRGGCGTPRRAWNPPSPPRCSGAPLGAQRGQSHHETHSVSPPTQPQGRGTMKRSPPTPNCAPRPWYPSQTPLSPPHPSKDTARLSTQTLYGGIWGVQQSPREGGSPKPLAGQLRGDQFGGFGGPSVGQLVGDEFVVGTTGGAALGLALVQPEPNHVAVVLLTWGDRDSVGQRDGDSMG